MKKKKKEVRNGHMTVAKGRGGEGSSQRSYDRWGGGGGGGVGGRRKGGSPGSALWARLALHSGPVGPATWARPTRHPGPSGPPSIKPVGLKKN